MNSIILTGANRGLGHALHEALAQETWQAHCVFLSRKPLNDQRQEFNYLHLDFGNPDLIISPFDIPSDSKSIIFINNAGTIEPIGKAAEIPRIQIEHAMRINCLSPLSLAQQLSRQALRLNARLFILNISSGAAHRPIKGWAAYCVSKAAAVMAFDVLAAENDHVDVIHLDPGVMDTDMQTHIRQRSSEEMPGVETFRELAASSSLKNPLDVAEQVMSIIRKKF
jgi:benzil reductase ((S)-benzoin forming)